MNDLTTNKQLTIIANGDAPPYLSVKMDQLDDVRGLLDANEVDYWVDEFSISIEGGPRVTVVNFSRNNDVDTVQKILDSVTSFLAAAERIRIA